MKGMTAVKREPLTGELATGELTTGKLATWEVMNFMYQSQEETMVT
jgi:hypothetical protein